MTGRLNKAGALTLVALLLGVPVAAQSPSTRAGRAPSGDTIALTLEDAVARTMSQSEEVRLARSQVDFAGAQIRGIRSQALPQVNGSVGYTRTFQSQFNTGSSFEIPDSLRFSPDSLALPSQRISYLEQNAGLAGLGALGSLFGNLPFGRTNAYSFNVSGSHPLYSGGRLRAAIESARLYEEAAGLQLNEQLADVELAARTAYHRAQFATELARISEAAVAQADQFLEQERLRERSGHSAELDVLRAEVSAANLRTQLVQSRNAAELAMLDLRRLVNIPAGQPVALTTTLELPSAAALAAAETDDVGSTSDRAAIAAAERNLQIRELGVDLARGAYFPSASLRVNYGRFLYPEQPFRWGGDSWVNDFSATVTVDVPIFDGFRRGAEMQQAHIAETQAQLQLAQLREALDIQYQQAVGERRRAATAITAQQRTVDQAQRVYDLTVLRYDRGLATQLEVSDARLALLQASTNLAQALSDFYVAEATVQRALGKNVTP